MSLYKVRAAMEKHGAFVQWVNGFPGLPMAVHSLADLCNGTVLAFIINKIAPAYISAELFDDVGTNALLRTSRFKQLLAALEDFYRDGLDIVGVHFDAIDAEAIVRRNDEAEVMKVMELVLASAVQCDDKTVYIEQIMGMGQEHQAELMVTIDSVMSRVSDSSSQRRGSSVSPTPRIPDGEMTATLQRDNQALKQAVSDLQTANLELTGELSAVQAENERLVEQSHSMKQKLKELEADLKSAAQSSGRLDAGSLTQEDEVAKLREELKRRDAQVAAQAAAARSEKEALEEESRRHADELELVRAQAASVSKLEATLDRYKKRLEDMDEMKLDMQRLEQENKNQLDKISTLELALKASESLKDAMDATKAKMVHLETTLSSVKSEALVKEAEIGKLRVKVSELEEQKRALEGVVKNAEEQLASTREDRDHGGRKAVSYADQVAAPRLRDDLAELRAKYDALLRTVAEKDGTAPSALVVVQHDLETALAVKANLEAQMAAAQSKNMDLEEELARLRDAAKAAASDGSAAAAAEAAIAAAQRRTSELEALQEERARHVNGLEAKLRAQDEEWVRKLQESNSNNATLQQQVADRNEFVKKVTALAERRMEELQRKSQVDLSKISEQLTSMSEQAEKNRVARDLANDRFKQAQKELELMSSIIYKIGIESYRKLLTVPAPGPDMSVLNRHRSQMSPMRALPQ